MGSPKASDWFASVATSQQPVLQPVNLAIFTTSSLFNPLAVPASSVVTFSRPPTITSLWTPAQRKRASVLYFANVFLFIFLWPTYSPALVNGSSRKFYTWWTLSVIREVTTWIFSWSSLGQKVTKFGVFSDPTRKLSALTPECGRIL